MTLSDRRSLASNGRVADIALTGKVAAERFVMPQAASVAVPLADLRAAPAGPRDRQLLYGQGFEVLERRDGWAFGRAARDGYVGYVAEADLGPPLAATHRVVAPLAHLYPSPDIKREPAMLVSFGAEMRVVSASGAFFEVSTGHFIAKPHLRPLGVKLGDPATVAQLHFGAPYLWGGNSALGIDCSGLVQAACLACAIPCPGDSDQQQATLGRELAEDEALARGDAVFWRGHVGLMVDGETLIHANAHAMAVAYEPLAEAVARIEAAGGGGVTARRRPA